MTVARSSTVKHGQREFFFPRKMVITCRWQRLCMESSWHTSSIVCLPSPLPCEPSQFTNLVSIHLIVLIVTVRALPLANILFIKRVLLPVPSECSCLLWMGKSSCLMKFVFCRIAAIPCFMCPGSGMTTPYDVICDLLCSAICLLEIQQHACSVQVLMVKTRELSKRGVPYKAFIKGKLFKRRLSTGKRLYKVTT